MSEESAATDRAVVADSLLMLAQKEPNGPSIANEASTPPSNAVDPTDVHVQTTTPERSQDSFQHPNSHELIRQASFLDCRKDEELLIFTEPPEVHVTNGRIEEAWPTKYVEYELQLKYKDFKWTVHLSKRNLYGLWFFVKSKGYIGAIGNNEGRHRPSLNGGSAIPQLRKLFIANAEKSVGSDMLSLVERYLQFVLNEPQLLRSSHVVTMLQVSASTFDDEGGYTSVKEGWLRVRVWLKNSAEKSVQLSRGNVNCDNAFFNCFCVVKKVRLKSRHWRWVALKKHCMAFYADVMDTNPSEVILFDSNFAVERSVQKVGSATSILVSNSAFLVQLDGKHKQSIRKWASIIRKTAEESVWAMNHRDESFSMPRDPAMIGSRAKWFVDGKDYYEAAYNVLLNAKKQIMIAGWWICPNIFLLRPPEKHPESELVVLLKKKAEEGVQIYIQMYKEVSVALTLNSLYSKKTLRNIHSNIHVIRDPDFIVKQLGMWSHHEKIVIADQKIAFVGGLDLCFGRWDTHDHTLLDEETPIYFPGKDYSNPRIKDFIDVEKPYEDLMPRENPRMPWHDVHCVVEGQPARDIARHFIQRWNFTLFTRGKKKKIPALLPKPDYTRASSVSPKSRFKRAANVVSVMRKFSNTNKPPSIRGFNKNASVKHMLDRKSDLKREPVDVKQVPKADDISQPIPGIDRSTPARIQVVRSVGPWSAGCNVETSVQNAYIRLIGEAKHFLYIENQFFVSGQEGDSLCNNRIANAIVNRIRRAAELNEPFRVMVVMPLLPAFPGRPDGKDAYSLRGVMHWQYRSICRGEQSIYERLYETIDDPFEYIAFFGLRTHGVSKSGKAVTEEVYIHSKTMIVDDRTVIIGSANINERSMNGDRDSEIAVVVEDVEFISQKVNGVTDDVGSFAHSYRMKLFEEHFGVEPGSKEYVHLSDPVAIDTWFDIQDHAMKNSQIYENVFGCSPSDSILTFKELGIEPAKRSAKSSPLRHARRDRRRRRQQRLKSGTCVVEEEKDDTASNEPSPTGSSGQPRVLSPQAEDPNGLGNALVEHRRCEAAIREHMNELSNIKGHIVYFPLNFLSEEELEPKLYPSELFQ